MPIILKTPITFWSPRRRRQLTGYKAACGHCGEEDFTLLHMHTPFSSTMFQCISCDQVFTYRPWKQKLTDIRRYVAALLYNATGSCEAEWVAFTSALRTCGELAEAAFLSGLETIKRLSPPKPTKE